MELARYVVLNPVRAGIVPRAADWKWSSYQDFMRCEGKPDWLETDWLLSHFGRDPRSSRKAYADYLEAGVKMQSPMVEVKHQVVLGDKEFVAKHLPNAAVSCLGEIAERSGE